MKNEKKINRLLKEKRKLIKILSEIISKVDSGLIAERFDVFLDARNVLEKIKH